MDYFPCTGYVKTPTELEVYHIHSSIRQVWTIIEMFRELVVRLYYNELIYFVPKSTDWRLGGSPNSDLGLKCIYLFIY